MIRRADRGRWGALLAVGLGFLALPPLRAAEPPGHNVTLVFHLTWGNEPLAVPSAALRNASGQLLRLTRLSALVSGLVLLRADGGTVQLPGQYGFLDAAAPRLAVTLTGVPAGDYRGLGFDLGLPAAVNHADPSAWPAGHPLNPLVNRLHWGWQGGYVFLALEGRWTAAAPACDPAGSQRATAPGAAGARQVRDAPDAPDNRAAPAPADAAASPGGFVYHLASDPNLMSCAFAAPFTIAADTLVDVAFDVARVLAKRGLVRGGESESTHSRDADAVAADLTRAVPRALFWLGSRPDPAALVAPGAPVAGAAAGSPAATGAGPGEQAVRAIFPAGGAAAAPLALTVPAGFPAPSLPADNPLTREGVALGAALFRDQRLSGNGRQSCASCHDPARAFADRTPLSRGANGRLGRRNTPSLLNLAWHSSYGWDGRQAQIRGQVLAALASPVEMNQSVPALVAQLGRDPALAEKFRAAFGTTEVTAGRLSLALEQYLITLVAADSKFDRAARGEATLSAAEQEGFALFFREYDPRRGQQGADCFHCHGGALFSDFAMKDNGLGPGGDDEGRAEVTGSPADVGLYKTPSLRELTRTGPYMHDGRFRTLEAVVAHYVSGVHRTPNLDPNLAKHPGRGVPLSADQQAALVAFLRTLSSG